MALVAQHDTSPSVERFVEDLDHALAIGRVGIGDRALLDLGPSPRPIVWMSVRNSATWAMVALPVKQPQSECRRRQRCRGGGCALATALP